MEPLSYKFKIQIILLKKRTSLCTKARHSVKKLGSEPASMLLNDTKMAWAMHRVDQFT